MLKYLLILLLTTLVNATLFAQVAEPTKTRGGGPEDKYTDSLVSELPKQKDDTVKVMLLCKLSRAFQTSDPLLGLQYGQQALDLSVKLGWEWGVCYSKSGIGLNYGRRSDFASAQKYLFASLNGWEKMKDKKMAAITCLDLGNSYRAQSMRPKALEYYFKALKLGKEIGRQILVANTLMSIGNVYRDERTLKTSTDYYLKSLEIAEKLNDSSLLARLFINLGGVSRTKHDFAKSLEYYNKCMAIEEKLQNRADIAMILTNIGNLHIDQKNFALAIESLHRSIDQYEELGNQYGMSIAYAALGHCYLEIARDTTRQGKYSIDILEPTTAKYKQTADIPGTRTAQLRYSIKNCEHSLALALKINAPRVALECYNILITDYELSGDFKKALEASDKYYAIEDSLNTRENKEEIVKLEMTNAFDMQHLSDSLKAKEKEKLATLALSKQKTYTYFGLAGILLLAGFSFFIMKERGKSEMARKKSEELLLNILPEEVATQLKDTGKSVAKQFDNVTVLFTDFVNFTEASERMRPDMLIEELDTCFKAFDEITARYNIEKIKTIGDAYLAVCGLPSPDPQHAMNIVSAAREINAFMENRLARLGNDRTFPIRIGIHSGSVVAGIVGIKKFAYDIWGDTVNTAARMEQHGEAGQINISQTTYELVKDKVRCTYRGELQVKGKGVMKMYFVS